MYLSNFSFWHPEEVLDNRFFEKIVDTSDEWITERVGIKTRRRAEKTMLRHELAVKAARKTVDKIFPEEIDLVLCTLSFSDHHVPATANLIARELKLSRAAGFDLRAACSSFGFGLHVLRGLFAVDASYQKCLLVVGEKQTDHVDYTDRTTCVLFGDGAASCLATREAPVSSRYVEVIDTMIGSRSEDALLIQAPVGGTISQQGRVVQLFAIRKMADQVIEILERHSLTPENLDWFIGHQANLRIVQGACSRLGLSEEKNLTNVECYGNTSAAAAPSVLAENFSRFRNGDLIAVSWVGSGLSWAVALLRAHCPKEEAFF